MVGVFVALDRASRGLFIRHIGRRQICVVVVLNKCAENRREEITDRNAGGI
jgi:hypothetical protein